MDESRHQTRGARIFEIMALCLDKGQGRSGDFYPLSRGSRGGLFWAKPGPGPASSSSCEAGEASSRPAAAGSGTSCRAGPGQAPRGTCTPDGGCGCC